MNIKNIFLPIVVVLSAFSISAQITKMDTLRSEDWCLNPNNLKVEKITQVLPIYTLHDSIAPIFEDLVCTCFNRENAIFNAFEISADQTNSTLYISILISYPINSSRTFQGIFFVNQIPFFINEVPQIQSNLISQSGDSICVVRKKDIEEEISCINYETHITQESFQLDHQNWLMVIENCVPHLKERKKIFARKKK